MRDEHFYTRAIKLDPKNSGEYYNGRAEYYCIEHNYDKAYKDFCKAKKLGIEIEKNYKYQKCVNYKEANKLISELNEKILAEPNEYRYYYDRANYYLLIKEYEQAFADANTALKLNPSLFIYKFMNNIIEKIQESYVFDAVNNSKGKNLIEAYKFRIKYAEDNINSGKNSEYWKHRAEKDLDIIIKILKDKTLALYLKVNFYESINDTGNAIMYCKRVVEQSKKRKDKFGKVLTYLYEVKLVILYTDSRKIKEATHIVLNHPEKPNIPELKRGLKYINSFAYLRTNLLKDKNI